MDKSLEENLKFFEEKLPGLLETDEGRFAVGRAGDNFTCWDTYGDAIQYGYERYGLNPFLVKQVERFERPIFMGLTAA
jgi:hypothetical protein